MKKHTFVDIIIIDSTNSIVQEQDIQTFIGMHLFTNTQN